MRKMQIYKCISIKIQIFILIKMQTCSFIIARRKSTSLYLKNVFNFPWFRCHSSFFYLLSLVCRVFFSTLILSAHMYLIIFLVCHSCWFHYDVLFFSSVRTWAVVSPVPVSIECDMKSLLSSFSFKASVLLNNESTVSAQVTTAEQRVCSSISSISS